jgi:hypothetical protein
VKDVKKLRAGMIRLQAVVRGAQVRDQDIPLDEESSEKEDSFDDDESFIDSSVYDVQNSFSPVFNRACPPVDSIELENEQFKRLVLLPLFENVFRFYSPQLGNGVPCAKGHVDCDCEDRSPDADMVIVGMLKRATYAYIVQTLS